MIILEHVKRCVTHHHACDCREWHYQQCIKALEQCLQWSERMSCELGYGVSHRAYVQLIRETLEALK